MGIIKLLSAGEGFPGLEHVLKLAERGVEALERIAGAQEKAIELEQVRRRPLYFVDPANPTANPKVIE